MRIVIIDDSTMVRMELREIFESEGYEVIEASCGEEAVSIFRRTEDVDMIYCDYNMPDMDGLETIEKITMEHPHMDTPIVLITTESSPELKAKSKTLGVRGWIVKPYTKEALLQATEYFTRTEE